MDGIVTQNTSQPSAEGGVSLWQLTNQLMLKPPVIGSPLPVGKGKEGSWKAMTCRPEPSLSP